MSGTASGSASTMNSSPLRVSRTWNAITSDALSHGW
jgi:hypothetical protein